MADSERTRLGAALVVLEGELDVVSAPAVREQLCAALQAGDDRLIVDLSQASFLDANCIGVLAEVARSCQRHGGWLWVRDTRRLQRRIFEILDLEVLLASPEEAAGWY